MDLMQIAGHLSLEFDAVVTGPYRGPGQSMVHVIKPDGYGVALLMGPGKAQAPESQPGGLDVWKVRQTEDRNIIDMSNTHDMIRWNTDLDGARQSLREVSPQTWEGKDTPPAPCETCGK